VVSVCVGGVCAGGVDVGVGVSVVVVVIVRGGQLWWRLLCLWLW
jgi:hypothetical protein